MGELTFQTLRESITSAIRRKILTGELEPGVKLAEQKLAEEFGSGRAPIREALRQLEQEGLIEYSSWAFQKLGQYYHVGDLFMIIYALCNVISQFAVLILSIDAPLRMLLDNEHTKQFIPSGLHKVNAHGVHSNGLKMVAVLSGSISFWCSPSFPALRLSCASRPS